MNARSKLALGLLGGYVLGRGRQAKLAALVLGYIAVKQGGRGLESVRSSLMESDEAKALTQQITTGLATAATGAATAAAGKGIHTLSENLQQRTAQLRDGSASETAESSQPESSGSSESSDSSEVSDSSDSSESAASSAENSSEEPVEGGTSSEDEASGSAENTDQAESTDRKGESDE
ncbi:hypothetical protein ACFQS2_07580 [Brachybacterium sp. GCM10030267]|uniref:hypothetical protein n=1 Tax=Brachybacterium sp. GCM10030267 TaxID=3273381 RepID=UPI0036161FF4